MTKRLYYTDPIKVLYMMKEFGVEFETELGNKLWKKDLIQDAEDYIYLDPREHGKYFVMQISNDEFASKDNDLMLSDDGESFFVEDVDREVGFTPDYEPVYDENPYSVNCKIIMRDNKHFFSGETEDE